MPTGLQILGDHTIAQIDENYRNLMFKAKGTFTCGSVTISPSRPLFSGEVTVTADTFPVLAVRASNKVGFMGFQQSGGSWKFLYASNVASTVVEYFHFDTQPIGDTANYLEVIDAAGARVFNALSKPMRVVDFRTPGLGGATYTSGRKYAGAQSCVGFSEIETDAGGMGGIGTYRSWLPCQTWTADNVVVVNGAFYGTGLQVGTAEDGAVDATREQWASANFSIIDVTGY